MFSCGGDDKDIKARSNLMDTLHRLSVITGELYVSTQLDMLLSGSNYLGSARP